MRAIFPVPWASHWCILAPASESRHEFMQATGNIIELRQLLAGRFPHLRQGVAAPSPAETWATGVPSLDVLLRGGLPRGAFTELVGAGAGSGSAQVLHALLRQVAADGQFLALVDGADSFDVGAVESEVLSRLLWVRCSKAGEALKAADLLLRDRNFPLVVLDLKLSPATQLRKISSSTWYRFARLLEHNRTTVLVVTPFELVSGAACRVRVESALGLDELSRPPSELVSRLRFTLTRATAWTIEDRDAQTG
jgi:hypothetical protein